MVVELAAVTAVTAETVGAMTGLAVGILIAGETILLVGTTDLIAMIVGGTFGIIQAGHGALGVHLSRAAVAVDVREGPTIIGKDQLGAGRVVLYDLGTAVEVIAGGVHPLSLAGCWVSAVRVFPVEDRAITGGRTADSRQATEAVGTVARGAIRVLVAPLARFQVRLASLVAMRAGIAIAVLNALYGAHGRLLLQGAGAGNREEESAFIDHQGRRTRGIVLHLFAAALVGFTQGLDSESLAGSRLVTGRR